MSDTTRSGADDAKGESKGVLESAQDTLSGATESVSNALGGTCALSLSSNLLPPAVANTDLHRRQEIDASYHLDPLSTLSLSLHDEHFNSSAVIL
jgi:hypothetical protein